MAVGRGQLASIDRFELLNDRLRLSGEGCLAFERVQDYALKKVAQTDVGIFGNAF